MIARCSPPWPRRSPWPSPSRFSLRAKIRPVTGFFQIPVRTVLPCHATSRGSPTLTETTTPIMEPPEAHLVSSTGSGNKARHTGLHHGVEPDVRLDALPNLPHGVFGQGRNLEVLLDIGEVSSMWSGKRCRVVRPRPAQPEQASCWTRCAMLVITGSSSILGIHAVSQRCKRQQYNPVLPAEVEQVPFRKIRMGFDLHHGRLDPRSRNDLSQLLQSNI